MKLTGSSPAGNEARCLVVVKAAKPTAPAFSGGSDEPGGIRAETDSSGVTKPSTGSDQAPRF